MLFSTTKIKNEINEFKKIKITLKINYSLYKHLYITKEPRNLGSFILKFYEVGFNVLE